MKKILSILIFFILASLSFFALPGELLEAADKPEKPKKISRADNYIAVVDLETVGKVEKDVKRPLTDSIRLEIVKAGKWTVIERSNMDKILKEQKFQQSCSSTECIVEVGQLLGVGKMIMGSVSLVGKTYYLSLQLVNVETGKIEGVAEDKCKCEIDDLIDSSKRLVKSLLGEQIATPEPVTKPTEAKALPKPEPKIEKPAADNEKTDPILKAAETKLKRAKSLREQGLTTQIEVDLAQEEYDTALAKVKGATKSTSASVPDIEMVFVKGGCYQMGEGRAYNFHEVCLDDFYIGKYEITQGQWKAVMGNNPSWYKDCGDSCPVEHINWNDIQSFLRKLNNKTGKSYRLPTEAEWEYAARNGGKNEKGANKSEVGDYGWYKENSGDKTHPVGQKKPNGLGIYDMSGNVFEWVTDWYADGYYKSSPKNNPTGPNSGTQKVIRGGSFSHALIDWVNRDWVRDFWTDAEPEYSNSTVGFRVAFFAK